MEPINEYEVALDALAADLAQAARDKAVLMAKLTTANQTIAALRAANDDSGEGASPAGEA